MKKQPPRVTAHKMSKADFETLAQFRYQLRRFLRFSEELARDCKSRAFLGESGVTVGELAERLQAKHHGVVSLISRCEMLGLVKRSRKRVEVKFTKRGQRHLERLTHLHRIPLESVKDRFAVPDLSKTFRFD